MIRVSDAEFEVMKVIWENEKITSSEIIENLKSYNWKANTIRTLIRRLTIKGAIEMIDIGTNKKIYRALIDKDEYIKQITKDLLKRLYNNSLMEFIFYYSQDSKTSTNEVKKEIQEILRKLK